MNQLASSSGPLRGQIANGAAKEFSWVRVLGIAHYVQAVIALLVVVLAGLAAFYFAGPNWAKGLPDKPEYENVGYIVGFMMIALALLCGWAFVFVLISFLIGSRLMRRRWRIFAIVTAVCETLWALAPLSLCILLPSKENLIFGAPFIIPITLGLLTAALLSRPAARPMFDRSRTIERS